VRSPSRQAACFSSKSQEGGIQGSGPGFGSRAKKAPRLDPLPLAVGEHGGPTPMCDRPGRKRAPIGARFQAILPPSERVTFAFLFSPRDAGGPARRERPDIFPRHRQEPSIKTVLRTWGLCPIAEAARNLWGVGALGNVFKGAPEQPPGRGSGSKCWAGSAISWEEGCSCPRPSGGGPDRQGAGSLSSVVKKSRHCWATAGKRRPKFDG